MRDSQRQRVYDAEQVWAWSTKANPVVTFDEAQDILFEAATEFRVPVPFLKVNTRLKQLSGQYRFLEQTIEIPGDSTETATILHEFGHHLSDTRIAESAERSWKFRPHGGSFVTAYLDVVRWRLGETEADSLAESFRFHKVLIGVKDELAHFKKTEKNRRAAEQKNWNKHGERGKVYIVKLRDEQSEKVRWIGMSSYTWFIAERDRAKVWRYRAAAVKHAKNAEQFGWETEIEEADGRYDARWKEWSLA